MKSSQKCQRELRTMTRFEGKVVLVTGAGVGIGNAVCREFASEGALVMLNDIDEDLAERAAENINMESGGTCVYSYPFDAADVSAIRSSVSDIMTRFGQIDVVAANAGVTHIKPFLETSPSDFDRLMNVNLRGTYFLAQVCAQAMIAKNIAGRILIMSSVTGVQAIADFSAYGVTKAGLLHMARILALELGPYNITVNAIAPGATVTERTLQEADDYEQTWAALTPSQRPAYVQDIAAAALFLASAEARQINGQALIIDGGWTISSPMPGYISH
jgi:glucose 1-dehydrogenase